MCKAPERYLISENLIFLNEFKTNGTGAGYNAVDRDGVFRAKPSHYKQMCQYGKHFQLRYGLYIIENKNDSDLTIQIVELDWNLAEELEKKAKDIIEAKLPPPRIADNPSYFDCKCCFAVNICHHGEVVETNCRSCKMATAVENGQWFCNRFNSIIPDDFIAIGCPDHQSVNE
jgi:hypothetical protein